MREFFTKEEIEEAGFIYEPDRSKCKSMKLKLCIPHDELINSFFKAEIVKEIPYVYVHKIVETDNPYDTDPNFLADPKVLIVGHTLRG